MTDGLTARSLKAFIRPTAAILIAALIILIPALINGFPFIFLPDTAEYLASAPLIYRSPFYGLVTTFFYTNNWIWLPVVMQAAIIAHLLWLMLKLHGVRLINITLCLLAIFLSLFSSLPYFAGFILADIFTPIMFIVMYLLAFHYSELSWPLKTYLLLLAYVSIGAHIANLTLAIALLGFLFVALAQSGYAYRRIGILLLPIGAMAATVMLFNSVVLGTSSLVPTGSGFLMANLIEYGPGRTYLEEACPTANYKICAYKDRLPRRADEFLWLTGIFQELGGFAGMKDESTTIVYETIARYPVEVAQMIAKNFIAGLAAHDPVAQIDRETDAESFYRLLDSRCGSLSIGDFLNSMQMRRRIPHKAIRQMDAVFVPWMFVALAGLGQLAARRGSRQNASLAAFVIFAILLDTLLCTAISGVHARYQARVTWLLPMAVLIIAFSLRAQMKHSPKQET